MRLEQGLLQGRNGLAGAGVHGASAEAAAGHAAAPYPRQSAGGLHAQVQLGAAHFVVAAQGLMGVVQQLSQRREVGLLEGLHGPLDPSVLRDDVAGPALQGLGQSVQYVLARAAK